MDPIIILGKEINQKKLGLTKRDKRILVVAKQTFHRLCHCIGKISHLKAMYRLIGARIYLIKTVKEVTFSFFFHDYFIVLTLS